ncbi:hypothetical protein WR25_09560 isoform N [Diploscapter pachys]|uniref:Protein kinase domain-containing protein n=1 Tax=Diploscapter pachys TaxID=2018661 RepID=A0A2A2KX65_9BILA|nr:hypothetical protein WR25_09560 isoform N [Diploscapter pachys]
MRVLNRRTLLDLFSIFLIISSSDGLRLEECNSQPLGMASGAIEDSQITASSSFDKQSVGPQNARLHTELASGAWCPKPQIHSSSYEYLQISLNGTHLITGVETQGRYGNGTGKEFPSEYMIEYQRPGTDLWIRYRNRTGQNHMTGNFDTTTAVMCHLDPPIVASKIRIVPHSKQTRTVCLRAELHGCNYKDGLLWYTTVPEGSRIGDQDFRDHIFEDTGMYAETGTKRGLGILSDGFVAVASPFEENAINGAWIGWNKHHTGGAVNLLFEFDQIRNFSEVTLAAYGHRMDSIDVIFSQDGNTFPLSSQISSLDKDRLLSNSSAKRYDLRIPLHKRMAKKVRITLKFSSDWLFLTEVHFSSGPISVSDLEELALYNDVTSYNIGDISEDGHGKNAIAILGLTVLFVILSAILCSILCLRRNRPKSHKAGIYDQPIKRDLIITHVGNKPTCNIFPTHSYLGQSAVFGAGNLYSSDKTTSTSVSSKSSSSNKHSPPNWSDFHFPPPPHTSGEERIYAEPCMTLPLLPSQKQNISTPKSAKHTSTTVRQPAKTKNANEDSVHYAAANIFSDSYGFDKIPKFSFANLQIGGDLGEGKFTVIRDCIMPNGYRAAYKSVKDKNNMHARKALLDELKTLHACGDNHPHILKLYGADETASLVLEYCALGDVRHFLKTQMQPITPSILLRICADVCSGMVHLENLGLVHGHLMPSNILLTDQLRAKVASPRGPAHHAQLRYSAPESILAVKMKFQFVQI